MVFEATAGNNVILHGRLDQFFRGKLDHLCARPDLEAPEMSCLQNQKTVDTAPTRIHMHTQDVVRHLHSRTIML